MLEASIRARLMEKGAVLVGFADMSTVTDCIDGLGAQGMYKAVSFAVPVSPVIIHGIASGPTPEYYGEYVRLNALLDALGAETEELLVHSGFLAQARTRARVSAWDENYMTALPHKTAATLAGLGWIGKSGLLVTREYGSAVRITTVLTNAPLQCGDPVTRSLCGNCKICMEACPAGAIKGVPWEPLSPREERVDVSLCAAKCSELMGVYGIDALICGKCIQSCPHTAKYLRRCQ